MIIVFITFVMLIHHCRPACIGPGTKASTDSSCLCRKGGMVNVDRRRSDRQVRRLNYDFEAKELRKLQGDATYIRGR